LGRKGGEGRSAKGGEGRSALPPLALAAVRR
jgi:hypothetical protein